MLIQQNKGYSNAIKGDHWLVREDDIQYFLEYVIFKHSFLGNTELIFEENYIFAIQRVSHIWAS